MFVTFEGLDFCGKTTQAQKLVDRLKARHQQDSARYPPVLFLREPGGTSVSERIRAILLDRAHAAMSDRAELMLFAASRAQIVDEVIKPATKRGDIVVCDRFYDSTTAYQAYGRGLDLEFVHRANSFAAAGIVPDLTILVDIPIDEIERRKNAAGQSFDRMESSGRAFYERVRGGYLALASAEPGRFVRINGSAAIETVAAEIWGEFLARAPQYASSEK